MFGEHWSSASGDIKYLIYHKTLKNHEIEGSNNFMSGSFSWSVATLPNFAVRRYCVSRDMFLVCNVIKQDHVIKGSRNYNDWDSSK